MGVLILADNVTIGGTTDGAGNTIAFNGGSGVTIGGLFRGNDGIGNTVLANSISSNGGLGIDLRKHPGIAAGDGVTPNDVGDGDVGANHLQNFPVLAASLTGGGIVSVEGTLNSTSSTTFRLEFFANSVADPSGFGEGETFLGSTDVTTDAVGDASFAVSLAAAVPVGHLISATATDPDGNTSEFSGVVEAEPGTPDLLVAALIDRIGSIPTAPGSPLATKLGDAIAKSQVALAELTKTPPDNQAALGNIEDAVGDLEAAVLQNGLDPVQGAELMDAFAAVARQLAVAAIDDAIARAGDSGKIAVAQNALADGDALRASGALAAFKPAVNKYKDALANAEGA